MRKLNSFLVAAMLLVSGSIFANNIGELDNPTKKLSTQIAELLKDNSFIVAEEDLTAKVLFTVNDAKEIVVLSVDTEDGRLEQFVKGRLNYQKVILNEYREGRTYTVAVRIAD